MVSPAAGGLASRDKAHNKALHWSGTNTIHLLNGISVQLRILIQFLLSMNPTKQLITAGLGLLALLLGGESLSAIQLYETHSPSRGLIGGKLTYTYSLQNDGAADESGTLFTNNLPPNAVYVSAVATNGTFAVASNVFSFRPERLLSGSTVVVQVVVTPVNAFDLTNSACWISSTGMAAFTLSVTPVDSARPGPQLIFGRTYHASTLLQDGRVLVTGGLTRTPGNAFYTKAAEVYTPFDNSFSLVGEMIAPRGDHTSTLLPNGMVLVAGGTTQSDGGGYLPDTAEVFDPASNTFSVIATSLVHRARHTATLLPNGDVILAGGGTNTTIERLRCENGAWAASVVGHLLEPRSKHVACLLENGKVLFAGGTSVGAAFAEAFDPESGVSQMLETPGTQLPVAAANRGRVLLQGYTPSWVQGAEVYDPESNTFAAVAVPPQSYFYARSYYLLLGNGDVLQLGGGFTSAVNIFDLRAGTMKGAPPLAARREAHTAVQFADGRILLMGGYINNDGSGDMRSTEFYAFRLDSDLDGMEDEWELANGFDPTRREDAVEDADGDGHTNLQEFLAGTDPHDPLNVLKIEPPQIIAQKMQIRFPTVIGKYYRVEKSNAPGLGSWVAVASNIPGNGQSAAISDPVDLGAVPWFYRVLLLP